MIIKKANIKDIDCLVEMWGKLSDYHIGFKDYLSPSEHWRQIMVNMFIDDLNRDDKIIFIAEKSDEIIGFIRCELRISSEIFSTKILGYISDLYVEEKYRGTDVAKNLFKQGIDWFRAKGIYDIRLNVNSENVRAVGFYEKIGFEELNKTLGLKLKY
ncbi:MAG: GNAT family N-acetyltransferase [Clostridiaceae bacterium]|nr:GNAT family N-acetyltransferase [Clostridiaceae bacterium]MBW4860728.1 GNAT family N-acetyltransferase [Clostridiaceae bacterium]MBW4869018.1 GNAT family N-acetyltransferase [Clostridiaceae bacterium]